MKKFLFAIGLGILSVSITLPMLLLMQDKVHGIFSILSPILSMSNGLMVGAIGISIWEDK